MINENENNRPCVECIVDNIYYSNTSGYEHTKTLKENYSNFMTHHPNVRVNIASIYKEIIKIIYDKEKEKKEQPNDKNKEQVTREFSLKSIYNYFKNQNKEAKVFFVKTTLFSWDDNDLDELINKLKTPWFLQNKRQKNHINVDYLGELLESSYSIHLTTNSNKGNYTIYFFLISSDDTYCFTQPFTLMTVKNFSKRKNTESNQKRNSHLDDLVINSKFNILAYYYDIIFDNENKFKDNFTYKMNTYFFTDNQLKIENTLSDPIINITTNKLLDILLNYRSSFQSIVDETNRRNSMSNSSFHQLPNENENILNNSPITNFSPLYNNILNNNSIKSEYNQHFINSNILNEPSSSNTFLPVPSSNNKFIQSGTYQYKYPEFLFNYSPDQNSFPLFNSSQNKKLNLKEKKDYILKMIDNLDVFIHDDIIGYNTYKDGNMYLYSYKKGDILGKYKVTDDGLIVLEVDGNIIAIYLCGINGNLELNILDYKYF